jgi:hypothetical protein
MASPNQLQPVSEKESSTIKSLLACAGQTVWCGSMSYKTMRLTSDILVQLGQVGTLILASLGIWVAMFNQHRQLNAQMFIEMSGRFQDLLRMFPTEAWLANRNPSAPLPPPSPEITDCTLYCLQLIADVYHLRQGRYISKQLWSAWEREIRHTLEGPVFQREWKTVAVEFSHNGNFQRYLETLMRAKSDGGNAAVI